MALAIAASGTQSATVTTEHTLATLTTGKTFVLVVDTGAMLKADELELRIYTICLTAGTERLAYSAAYVGAQETAAGSGAAMKYSVPVPADISFRATLKQTVGTSRNFPWKVLSLD